MVAIVGAIINPKYLKAGPFGQMVYCKSNCKNIGKALDIYKTDNKGRYPTSLSLLTPEYLKIIPTCPAAASDTYSSTYTVANKPDNSDDRRFTFYCKGENHTAVAVSENFPQYSSHEGLKARP